MRRFSTLLIPVLIGACDSSTSPPSPAAIVVSPDSPLVLEFDSLQLVASLLDSAGNPFVDPPVAWLSLDSAVATVSSNGMLHGVRAGVARIWTASEGVSAVTAATVAVQFVLVAAAGRGTCGTTARKRVYCDADPPLVVPAGDSIALMDMGPAHACGIGSQGAVYCWGRNPAGELGVETDSTFSDTLVTVPGLTLAAIGAGDNHTCGIAADGRTYCWGANSWGQLGRPYGEYGPTPEEVSGGHRFATIAVGLNHSCAATVTGEAYCWGWNNAGQIGDGTVTERDNREQPTAVLGGQSFMALGAGMYHTCGVAFDGAGYCWGGNYYGKLGTGDSLDHSTPTAVAGGLSLVSVTGGDDHTCALTDDGEAYCWGSNRFGQLGDGNAGIEYWTPVPVAVTGGLSFRAIDAGWYHTCGTATNGKAYCWGYAFPPQPTPFLFQP